MSLTAGSGSKSEFKSLSGPCRRQIGPSNERLNRYLSALKAGPINPEINSGLSPEKNRERLEIVQLRINDEIRKISSTVKILDEWHNRWLAIIEKSNHGDAVEEIAIYENMTSGENNFVSTMDNAPAALDQLEAKKKEAESLQRSLSPRTGESVIATGADHDWMSRGMGVHATPYSVFQIPEFAGDVKQWNEFWNTFEALVHSTNLNPMLKHSVLCSKLKGEAFSAIEGYVLSTENYPLIVETLRARFGDQKLFKHYLHSELQHLPRSSEKIQDLRWTVDAIERICRQLIEQGESIESSLVAVIIESEMPKSILMEIYKHSATDRSLTVKELREKLTSMVNLRERIARIDNDHPAGKDGRNGPSLPSMKGKPHRSGDKPMESNASVTANEQKPGSKQGNKNKPSCIFCGGGHTASNCNQYRESFARRARAAELSLCYRCLRTGHMLAACKNNDGRRLCKGNRHHTALCKGMNQRSSNEQDSSAVGKTNENKANAKQSKSNAVAICKDCDDLYND